MESTSLGHSQAAKEGLHTPLWEDNYHLRITCIRSSVPPRKELFMKKKTLSIVLLVAMVFTELFTSVNFITFAQDYHSEDAYQQLGIIHMRNTEDDIKQYINSRIESICSTGTITPRNKANTRGLNPFIYDTSLKVVYGVPFGEFSYSEDGTMMEPSTKKRGEYMYLGYSYEGWLRLLLVNIKINR